MLEGVEARTEVEIITWNLQRASMWTGRQQRIREFAATCLEKQWDILLLTEITAESTGSFWIGDGRHAVVVIHSTSAAVMLCRGWAHRWKADGERCWLSGRVAAVAVANLRLVACYHPSFRHNTREQMAACRQLVEEQFTRARAEKQWLIVGGDFNMSAGRLTDDMRNEGLSAAHGGHGFGETNEAGRNFLRWCIELEAHWSNSFYQHGRRGTWWNQNQRQWHELDGFITRASQRTRWIKDIRVIQDDSFSDHRPVRATVRLHGLSTRKPDRVKWEALRLPEVAEQYAEATSHLSAGWTESTSWTEVNAGLQPAYVESNSDLWKNPGCWDTNEKPGSSAASWQS